MKRACIVCLYLFFAATLFPQSNSVSIINEHSIVVSPTGPLQFPSQRVRLTSRHQRPIRTPGLSFAPVVTYGSGGYDAYSVAVSDVNGDGKPDLVVANFCAGTTCGSGGAVGLLLGNGDGTFQTAVTYGSGGYDADSVAVADLNGDGKPDLVISNLGVNGGGASVGVLLGNGDGTFQTVVTYGSGGVAAQSVAIADVNGDGKLDIVVANNCVTSSDCSYGTAGVLLGNGDGSFQTAVTYGSGGIDADSVAIADLNGDGKPDLVVSNQGCDGCGASVGILLGNGDGTFQTAVTYGGGYIADSVAVADVNGDGKPDIVVANYCVDMFNCVDGQLLVLLGIGDGTFQRAEIYDSGGQSAFSVAVADVNGDGKPDLVVANFCVSSSDCSQGGVSVLVGNGDGTFQAAVSYGSGGYLAFSVAVADVNGDSKPDLLVANRCVNSNNCNNSTVGVLISISLTSTTTSLTSSQNPSNFGQSVTFAATVTSQDSGKPTGTVTFTYGGTNLCTAVTLSGGTATCASSSLPVGSDSVSATYSGDSNFNGSAASFTQTVSRASTTVTLSSSINPSSLDSPVTFTATIAPQYGGQTSGTVTFKDGSTTRGRTAVSGNAASLITSGLTIGTHTITATYSGDSNFGGSRSSPYSQVVTKATTTTTLLSSINPSVQGKPVTFTAAVSSLAGTPTGKIEYLNGTAVLATVTLTSGSAKYTTSTLPAGSNSITAVYKGDSKNSGSTSAPVNQFVARRVAQP